MKKTTALLIGLLFSITSLIAQDEPGTFSWANQADYMVDGELVVKPGDVIDFIVDYKLGVTGGVDDTFEFNIFSLEENADTNAPVAAAGWNKAEGVTAQFPGPGFAKPGTTDGTMRVNGSLTVPAESALSSEGTKAYRILVYVAYKPGGDGAIVFGGANASDNQLISVKSQEEIDATLSTNDFSKDGISSSITQSEGSINIDSRVKTETYKLYDLSGSAVIEKSADGSIDVSGLPSGVYIVVTDSGLAKVAF